MRVLQRGSKWVQHVQPVVPGQGIKSPTRRLLMKSRARGLSHWGYSTSLFLISLRVSVGVGCRQGQQRSDLRGRIQRVLCRQKREGAAQD